MRKYCVSGLRRMLCARHLSIRGASFALAFFTLAILQVVSAMAAAVTQTDWSGGPEENGAVSEFGDTFSRSENISWLSVPGRLALSSVSRSSPTVTRLTDGSYQGAESVFATDVDGDG